MKPDFSGYATRAGVRCTDGRTIMPNAFAHFDGKTVPLVWQHGHSTPSNVLGHATLEHRNDGIYATGFFNKSDPANHAKSAVHNGDITAMSIYANRLKEERGNVIHGNLVEVSLVISGANPEATIDNVYISHADGDELLDGAAVITSGETLSHADDDGGSGASNSSDSKSSDSDSKNQSDDKTVGDVIDGMTDEQVDVLNYLVGKASEGATDNDSKTKNSGNSDNSEGEAKHMNVFDENDNGKTPEKEPVLSHSDVQDLMKSAEATGSFQDALKKFFRTNEDALQHAESLGYGIDNLEFLFPDARTVGNEPEMISRNNEWVSGILSGTRKQPFSRIKTLYADITADEARAKGYITGERKKEEFFGLAKRETAPTTIYKKQKLDRDDIIDITTLDVVSWLWKEMRVMLNEEIARSILFGDGRSIDDPDKVNSAKIRPIATDNEFFTHKLEFDGDVLGSSFAKDLVKELRRSKKHYKGTGMPTLYISEHIVTEMLLEEDQLGRPLYANESELASALRVGKIVTVDLLDPDTVDPESELAGLIAILVNPADYTVGTDKGGEITTFDDFDIDFNQYKYLIEGRMSGSLTRHKSAVSIWKTGTVVEEGENVFPAREDKVGFPPVDQPKSNHPSRRGSAPAEDETPNTP